jgi:acyl-ACP thioesterase
MKPIWETSFNIRAFDVDVNNRLKVSAIFDYFQDAASLHADNLKVGYDDLIPKGYFWVLSWAKIEFSNYPKFKDEVKIQTWGKKQFKLYSLRDFILYSSDENIMCKGTTAWLLLDAKTLRPKVLTQLFPDVLMLPDKSALEDLPEKFPILPQTEIIFSKEIKYSDIDLNKHANNAKYVELIQDCYNQEFHNSNQLKSLTISFLSEAKYGQNLEILKSIDTLENEYDYIETKNIDTNKDVFKAILDWK